MEKNISEKIAFKDIRYIEAKKNHVAFVLPHKQYTDAFTMKEIEAKLPAGKFIRVHLSYIVYKESIERIEGNHLCLKDIKLPIPIGTTFRKEVMDKLQAR